MHMLRHWALPSVRCYLCQSVLCLLRLKMGSTLQQSRAKLLVSNGLTVADTVWRRPHTGVSWHTVLAASVGKGACTGIIIELMTTMHGRTSAYHLPTHGRLLCVLFWSMLSCVHGLDCYSI